MPGPVTEPIGWSRSVHARIGGRPAVPSAQVPQLPAGAAVGSIATGDPWVGLGLLSASLLVRLWIYRNLATDGPEPALVLAGWTVVASLFPAGNAGAALLVMQTAVVAAGVSLAVRTRGFSELDADAARSGSLLYLAGIATLVPVAALVLVVILNLVLLLLLGLVALVVLRVFAGVLGR